MSHAAQILAALAVPLAGALLISATARRPALQEAVSVVTAVALFGLVVSLAPAVVAGETPRVALFDIVPGLPIAFALEPLGMLFALIASFLWIATTVYSIGYVRANKEGHQTRYYVCFAVALGSTIGIAFAGNMFTLFLFYEALTLSTYPLVTHSGTEEARRAGRTYLGILLSTSILLQLFAILWTWVEVGTLDFEKGGILAGAVSERTAAVLLVLYMFGIGKAALMPLHAWLPAAMVAPTPVSALLHAVAVVKAGVFTVLKVLVYIFGLDYLRAMAGSEWLIAVAAATIVIASLIALRQDDLKRRLAYSTVSQLAYVVLGGALATSAGVVGGAMHMATHAFGKITLFFCAGAIYTAAHKRLVSELDGIGYRMPVTMGAFTVGALGLIGLTALRRALEQVVPGDGRRRRAPYRGDRRACSAARCSTRSTSCRSSSAPSSPPQAQAPAWRPAAPRRPGRSWRRPWWRRSARPRSSSTRRLCSPSFSLSQRHRKRLT